VFWQAHRGGLGVLAVAFLLIAAPMAQYALRFPDDFNARINEVGIIQSGWLENEVVVRGQPVARVLFKQFEQAALAFHYYVDRTVWYGLGKPLLDPLFGAVFLVGLFAAMVRLFTPAGRTVAPMLAWWWAGVLLGGVLTESPPSSQRLITLAVPVVFLIAYALWQSAHLARRAFPAIPPAAVLAPAALLFAFISLSTYFIDYTPRRIYGGGNGAMATQIAPLLNDLKGSHHFYFVGPPQMYWGFATLPYLVPGAQASDVLEPLTPASARQLVTADATPLFIVHPSRQHEIVALHDAFSNVTQTFIRSPVNDQVTAVLVRVSATTGAPPFAPSPQDGYPVAP
jgi:hypothetical protein